MKKQSKTTTVYRMNLEKGNYTTIARAILLNTNLSDSAKTLLQLCLNNVESWKLSLNYYKKLLNWSNDKMSGAVENLINEGYMTKDKKPNGKNGFTYIYVISEYGNLNPNKEQPSLEEIHKSIEDSEIELNKEEELEHVEQEQPVLPASSVEEETEVVADATETVNDDNLIETVTSSAITNEQIEEFQINLGQCILNTLSDYRTNQKYQLNFFDFYSEKYLVNLETLKSFDSDIEKIKASIIKNIEKKEAESMAKIEDWIKYHNTKGTAIQREEVKNKTIRYFNDKLRWELPLFEAKEKDVENRVFLYRNEIVSANRVHDSRYQD